MSVTVAAVLARGRARAWQLAVNGLLRSSLVGQFTRPRLLSLAGMRMGEGVAIRERVEIDWPHLSVGDRVFISADVTIDNHAPVTIGDDVLIAPGVLMTTTSHRATDPRRRGGLNTHLPITIGAGTWIGARAVVLQGVSIAEGCVIAAGAVVTRDCEANGLYAGVPARRVRDLPGLDALAAPRTA